MIWRIALLASLAAVPAASATDILVVADEIPAMEVLSRQLNSRIGVSSTIVTQDKIPDDLSSYRAVMVYIHKSIGEPAEKTFIAYARGGGKLFLLHHSISSGKRENKYWFPFLDISLPNKPYSEGGYKYFDPVDFDVVNLAPGNYITSHNVTYSEKFAFPVTHTEVYLNHVFTGPRTILLGIKYTDKTTGKVYEQPTAGWYRPAGKGMVFYFMVGHNTSDFDNPIYAQILANAVTFAIQKKDWYLFTSFRNNGETGVYLALSPDGRQWTPLNGDKPWVRPEQPGMLMRDPWLGQGPDGTWHMLWTWGWTRAQSGPLKVGYSSSKDLIAWTPQKEIQLLENEPSARNAWAPEAVWDSAKNHWVMFWSTTIPRAAESEYDHRIYSTTTEDWQRFTPARLYFNPGFSCIDSTVVHDGSKWIMIFKDERKTPLKKNLRLAFADSPEGPWRDVSEPFTEAWNEGPTATKIGSDWWIYFDHYQKPQHYGAMKTRDWKTFEDVTGQMSFPAGQRHGTVVPIPEELARKLQSSRSDRAGVPNAARSAGTNMAATAAKHSAAGTIR